ncbi:Asd/ArgC dimerization domain-containing protein, partial [Rheinheimera sp. 1928-s]|uniref:Asd/ArgC dimerization domain-containing protein n=1 Tax=Rheinheimera sp. 1928-s TaxID=3033803 RepID=UPI00260BB1A9
VKALLANAPGVTLMEDNADYPTQVGNAAGQDDVFVGRIRQDFSHENGINLWVVLLLNQLFAPTCDYIIAITVISQV